MDPKHLKWRRRSAQRHPRRADSSSHFEQSLASLDLDAILDRATDFARDFVQLNAACSSSSPATAKGLRMRGSATAWEQFAISSSTPRRPWTAMHGDDRSRAHATRCGDRGERQRARHFAQFTGESSSGVSTRAKRSGLDSTSSDDRGRARRQWKQPTAQADGALSSPSCYRSEGVWRLANSSSRLKPYGCSNGDSRRRIPEHNISSGLRLRRRSTPEAKCG